MFTSKKLLSVSSDSKTVKGEKLGFLTGILYLMPDSNICPNALNAGCITTEGTSCLVMSGRAAIFTSINEARARKTRELFEHPVQFMARLQKDIQALIRKAEREGLTPVVRLNGTSDIDWTAMKIDGLNLFEIFPDCQFYDYSKLPRASKHANYHITASYSSKPAYAKTVAKAIRLGLNLAVVFHGPKPSTFLGLPVIDGDASDLRFLDEGEQVVVALKAKGEAAKHDSSGFVVRTDNLIAVAA